MKNILERYLSAVERKLPKEQAKDIVAELREVLGAKIDARADARGGAATDDDVAAVLKEYGHPTLVASRYTGRDSLIGPSLYPWFWPAQRMVVGATVAINIAIYAVRALSSDEPVRAIWSGLGNAADAAFFSFFVVTMVFIVMERSKEKVTFGKDWNPKELPEDHIRPPKPLFDSLLALVFDAVFILWWVKVIDFPNEVPGEGTSMSVHFAAAWSQVYVPILVLALVTAAVHVADIFHPAWSRLRAVISILGHAGGLAVLWVLFRAGPLASVEAAASEGERSARIAEAVNGVLTLSLGVVGIVWAIGIGVEVWRMSQSIRPKAPAATAPMLV